MPYSSVSELPARIRKLSPKRQRQFMHVFNSVFKQTGDEGRAFAAANSAVSKKEFELEAEEILAYSAKDLTRRL